MRLRQTALSIALLNLAACSSWPEPGSGGFAEAGPQRFLPVESEQPLTPAHGLRFDYQLASLKLQDLIDQGAQRCFPAAVLINQTREKRIIRELEGGLMSDAQADIIVQRHELQKLQNQLQLADQTGACQTVVAEPQEPTPIVSASNDADTVMDKGVSGSGIDLDGLRELLNSDNQFAFGSSDINPKYAARLVRAYEQLRELADSQQDLQLRIVGHADRKGSEAGNWTLSQARAKKVAEFMTGLGLPASQIITHSAGDQTPLFNGDGDAVRLVNRRVQIDLVWLNSANPNQNQTPKQDS